MADRCKTHPDRPIWPHPGRDDHGHPDDEAPFGGIRCKGEIEAVKPSGMTRLVLADGTTYEIVGFGHPRKGMAYISIDEDSDDAHDVVNVAAVDHALGTTLRVLLEKIEPCPHPEDEQRSQTETHCGKCGEVLA